MSGYWDAVDRAALGLPGSAGPRPRSMFETDQPIAAPDDLEAVEQEIDTPPARVAPTPAKQPAPSPEPMAAHPVEESAQDRGTGPPPTPAHDVVRQRSDTRAEVSAPPTVSSAMPDDRVQQAPAAPPSRTVAQIEVQRIETTRTIIEPVEARTPPGAEVAAWKPLEQEPATHHVSPAEPAAAAVIEPPSAIVAEPLAPSPALSRPPPAPDPQPLVIEIGRIDIRIASETATPPVATKRRDAGTVPSLDDYLARRSEARR